MILKPRAKAAAAPAKTRRRLYYGWIIVAVTCYVGVVQTGQFNPTIGIFIKPVTEEFGWSRSVFVGAHSIGTVLGGVTGFLLGPAVDRWGPKWIVSIGLAIVGAALFGQAFIQEIWQFYLCMIVGRMALQGAVNIASNVTVSKWFVRERGRAVALASLGTRAGNGTSPLAAQGLIAVYDWRVALAVLGVITWSALLPAFIWLRRQPEDIGLRPDGDPPGAPVRHTERSWSDRSAAPADQAATAAKPRQRARPPREAEVDFTLRQALRTRALYLLILSLALSAVVASGVSLNLVAYLQDEGMSRGAAVGVVTTWSVLASIGSLVSGFIGERLPVRGALIGIYLGMAVTVLILVSVGPAPLAFLYGALDGFLFGSMATLQQMIFPEYFGRASLGAIRGVATMFQMIAIAIGPIAAASVFDAVGSYKPIFWGFLGSYVLSALVLLAASKPTAPAVGFAGSRDGTRGAQ